MVPVVKDKNRSIAISSILLKIINWIIMILFKDNLALKSMQHDFQENSNPLICLWIFQEVLELYLKKGGSVCAVLMDCTKAFDTVEHRLLFEKLLRRKIHPIFLRLQLYS